MISIGGIFGFLFKLKQKLKTFVTAIACADDTP